MMCIEERVHFQPSRTTLTGILCWWERKRIVHPRNTLMMPRTSRDDQKYIVLSVHHSNTIGMLRQTSEGDIPTSKLNWTFCYWLYKWGPFSLFKTKHHYVMMQNILKTCFVLVGFFHFRLDNKAAVELFLISSLPLRYFQCIIVKCRIWFLSL